MPILHSGGGVDLENRSHLAAIPTMSRRQISLDVAQFSQRAYRRHRQSGIHLVRECSMIAQLICGYNDVDVSL